MYNLVGVISNLVINFEFFVFFYFKVCFLFKDKN